MLTLQKTDLKQVARRYSHAFDLTQKEKRISEPIVFLCCLALLTLFAPSEPYQ